jgi:hypothetical protein
MIKSIITFFLVLITVSSLIAQDSKNLIVSTKKAGNFKIGMTKEEILTLCNNCKIKENIKEGEEDYYLEIDIYISINEVPSISLQMDSDCQKNCVVESMVINDATFVTSKGISVGNSVTDLSKAYKISEIYGVVESYIPCITGKCEPIIYTSEMENIGFVLDSKEEKWSFGNQVKLKDIPKDTKIKGIYLF